MQTTIKDFNDFKRYVEQQIKQHDFMILDKPPITIRKREPFLMALPTLWGYVIYQAFRHHSPKEIWLTFQEIKRIHEIATQ